MRWHALAATALSRVVPPPRAAVLPPGRLVDLPGRGSTFVVDVPGPPGAPTLILLHALGCTAYLTWFPSIAPLTQHFRVVAFDQRWHGRGVRSPEFDFTDCSDDVIAVADALGVDRFVLAGYSMGGAIAQLAWQRWPGRIDGLVLCATGEHFRGRLLDRVWGSAARAAMWRLGPRAYGRMERLASTLLPEPIAPGADTNVPTWAMSEFRSTSAWAMLAVLSELGRFDSSRWIGDVDVPSSVVVVTRDRLVPSARQQQLADLIPRAQQFHVDASHAACVLGADAFVPTFVEACRATTQAS